MVILDPIVKKLSRFKVPKALSVLIVYFTFFGMIILSLVNILQPLIDQTTKFASGLPMYIANLHIPHSIEDQIMPQVLSKVGDVPGSVVNIGVFLISNVVTLLTILTFAFYLLMARNKMDGHMGFLFGSNKAKEIDGLLDELEVKLGGW